MSVARYLTPPEAATLLGVEAEKVRTWITGGELRASNLALHRGGRPRWRIAPADLEIFLSRRSSTPTPPAPRRRRTPANIIKYF